MPRSAERKFARTHSKVTSGLQIFPTACRALLLPSVAALVVQSVSDGCIRVYALLKSSSSSTSSSSSASSAAAASSSSSSSSSSSKRQRSSSDADASALRPANLLPFWKVVARYAWGNARNLVITAACASVGTAFSPGRGTGIGIQLGFAAQLL